MRSLPFLAILALLPGSVPAQETKNLTQGVNQLLVAIAKDWDSNRAQMWRFKRTNQGWEAVSEAPVPVMLGRNGLAWGRGVSPVPDGANLKREGDWRTPAGLFAVTKIYGYPEALPAGSDFPYREVGPYDAWVDDPKNPHYNRHYVATPGKEPAWFKSQRMRMGDSAYKYRVEIRHNSDPPVPGFGSAIFFHIRRGPDKPSAGCTTMAETELVRMIQWLRAKENPHYVILPKAEYDRVQAAWGLPEFK